MMVVRSATKAIALKSFGFAMANPGAALGSLVFISAFALVAGNALVAQPGLHPDPLWTTRDAIVTKAIAPKPAVRLRKKTHLVQPVSLKDVPVPVFKVGKPIAKTPSGRSVLVSEIQKELNVLNLYHGEIDGIYGTNTKNAISELQTIIGLQANGLATQDLLDLLRSRGDSQGNKAVSGNHAPEARLVKEIQMGLSRLGPHKLDVDGIYGAQTADAIRAFQENHKLKVDGKPSETVLDKLIQIGAMRGT